MSIRRATGKDLAAILQLFSTTIQRINRLDYSDEQIQVWSEVKNTESWNSKIRSQYFIIKEINNQIVGFSSLEVSGYLVFLYVHPDHQRNGIASELFDNILQQAFFQKNTLVWASVSITAQPFFLKKGFTIRKQEKKSVDGINFINMIMDKKL